MPSVTQPKPPALPQPARAGEAFAFLRKLVLDRAAISLDADKEYLVEARLSGIARRRGLDTAWDLLLQQRCQPDANVLTEVVEAMTTNETSFFRDPGLFNAIQNKVIPELVERRSQDRRLSIWSAACSTGQEPYSLAMLLKEQPKISSAWNVRILATDLSRPVLDRARSGTFSKLEVNRGLAANRLLRWFNQTGSEWVVSDELKRLVDYRQMNRAGPWATVPPADLVLLRNVLIYFPPEIKQRVLERIRGVLRPDGYLILGNAETTLNLDSNFQRVDIGGASAFRVVAPKR